MTRLISAVLIMVMLQSCALTLIGLAAYKAHKIEEQRRGDQRGRSVDTEESNLSWRTGSDYVENRLIRVGRTEICKSSNWLTFPYGDMIQIIDMSQIIAISRYKRVMDSHYKYALQMKGAVRYIDHSKDIEILLKWMELNTHSDSTLASMMQHGL